MYLSMHFTQVDVKFTGKTALHCATAAGKVNIVESLLELGANLECEVYTCVSTHCSMHIITLSFRMRLASDHSTTVL